MTNNQLTEFAERKVKHLTQAIGQSAFTSIRLELENELALAKFALSALQEHRKAAEPVGDEELDQMIWKLERDGMTPKMLSLMRELREVRRAKPVTLSVWYGAMPESNGRENWTAMLHRKGAHPWEGIMIDRSEYPGRALYEADRMRFLIGEIDVEPDILAYDSETHSGYAEKLNQPVSETERTYQNSFTDAELEMMAHGDNPQANAYRELLAFRRNSPATPDGWKVKAERMAELHGCSFVVFRHGEDPQCADPTKVIISFTDKGLGYVDAVSDPGNHDCQCRTCRPVTISDMRFVVCPDCGNKRCPKANDHNKTCTGSNEPGQDGSANPAAPQEVK